MSARIETAGVVLPCTALDPSLAFFTERLGFRIDAVFPADAPAVACLSGHGLRIRLQIGADTAPGTLRLRCRHPDRLADESAELIAPNGTRIELEKADARIELPPLRSRFVVNRRADRSDRDSGSDWGVGRAGMLYRDLIPDRQGGRYIASHIRIPHGGPVPDYVHFHAVHFQMIYCYHGWVRLVYEDQGPPFVMQAGDCVLQPPRIRHRVLECSDVLEVIELGCPAEHETRVDHDMTLPTSTHRPDRDFAGQRFVHHATASAIWRPWRLPGFESRDLGITQATEGVAAAHVVRVAATTARSESQHDAEFWFGFVLAGEVALHHQDADEQRLHAGDAFVIPAGHRHALDALSSDLEILEVALPGNFSTDLST